MPDRISSSVPTGPPDVPGGVSLLIPTWNGRRLLAENLPAVLSELVRYREEERRPAELLVVDDGSTDGTAAWLEETYAGQIEVVARPANGGFAAACNAGFAQVQYPVTVLLNNDVHPRPGFLRKLLDHFRAPGIFGVTCRVLLPGSSVLSTGAKAGLFRRGFWSFQFNLEPLETRPAPPWLSAVAPGGFVALNTAMVRQLGGFLDIYNPFYWEDVDLSYRAWKRGWAIHYEPAAEVYHQPSSTIGPAFRQRQIDLTAERNRLLFHWINLHDRRMIASHLFMLLLKVLSQWAGRRRYFYEALGQAWGKWPPARRLRREELARLAAGGKGEAVPFTPRSDDELRTLFRREILRPGLRLIRSQAEAEMLAGLPPPIPSGWNGPASGGK